MDITFGSLKELLFLFFNLLTAMAKPSVYALSPPSPSTSGPTDVTGVSTPVVSPCFSWMLQSYLAEGFE
jgi:hypothetical protein